MIIFYNGRDNGAYVRLSANGVVADLNAITKLEIQVAGQSFNTVDNPEVVWRDGDKYAVTLGAAGLTPGTYAMEILAYSIDKPLGVVWGAPVKVAVRAALGPTPTPAPVFLTQPQITGASQVGEVLTAVDGTASNATTLTRQWYMDDAEVVGETGTTYTSILADVGKVPGVRNFATGPGGGPVQSSLATAAPVVPVPIVPTIGIIVANRLQVPTIQSGGNVNPLRAYQREHTAHADGEVSNLRLTNLWWILSPTTFLPAAITGNPTFTWRQWVEYPQGVFTPVLFGGNPDCVLSTTTKLRRSDAMGVVLPAGAKFWVHTVHAGASAVLMPVTETPAFASVIGTADAFYDMMDLSSPVHQAGGSATVNFIGPSLITGDVAATGAEAVLVVGDSLVYGQGDVTSVGARGSSGAYARKLDENGASYVKYAQKGATLQAYAAGVANVNYVEFMDLVRAATTHVVIQPGINDVRLARTQANVLADRATLVANFPGKSLVQTTLTPRTSSTDAWATVANQTQQTDGNMAQWANINTAIRAAAGAGLMEVANVVANTPGGTVWATPAGATPPVLDGTHMTSAMAAYAAANIAY